MGFDSAFDPASYPYASARACVYAARGMVATSHPLAAQAGLGILKQGGNAVDAAVATAAALTVLEPTSNGIGGDAFALVWHGGKLYGLNSSGRAPASISIDKVRALGHSEMPRAGILPVTVPGAPGAWAELSGRFGTMRLAQLLAPAVIYARDGHPVAPTVARFWKAAAEAYGKLRSGMQLEPWFDTFAPGGRAPRAGEIWASRGHADTLMEIGATNAESFYRGRLAELVAGHCAGAGGFVTADDMAAFRPEWVEPVRAAYRGHEVWEIPPNCQGMVALVALNILKGYSFGPHERGSAATLHRQFEAIKLAFALGKAVITDAGRMRHSVAEMLSDGFADGLRAKIGCRAAEPCAHPPAGGTVYLCAADAKGNMVSYIQSNYMGFGSGAVVPGTGIALQNRGADFSLDPDHPNALEGGKRTYHTIMPGFLTKGGEAAGPFGVMGGYMQPQGHVQLVMNTLDFAHNPQAALDAPRWQWTGGRRFEVEAGFDEAALGELRAMGHEIAVARDPAGFGRGQAIWRCASGALVGGTEPRADGAVAGI